MPYSRAESCLDWKHIKPRVQSPQLMTSGHGCVESFKPVWMLLQPFKEGKIGIESELPRAVRGLRRILELGSTEKFWEFHHCIDRVVEPMIGCEFRGETLKKVPFENAYGYEAHSLVLHGFCHGGASKQDS